MKIPPMFNQRLFLQSFSAGDKGLVWESMSVEQQSLVRSAYMFGLSVGEQEAAINSRAQGRLVPRKATPTMIAAYDELTGGKTVCPHGANVWDAMLDAVVI